METKTEKSLEKPECKEPETPRHKEPETPASNSDLKPGRFVLIAAIPFSDAVTGKSFKAGDVVDGWDERRIAHYIARGVVYRTTQIAPKEVK